MITDKLISLRSQHSEAQRNKKFVRKTTQSFNSSRPAKIKKQTTAKPQNQVSTNNGNDSFSKIQTETQKFFKNQEQALFISPKRNTQSLKSPINKGRWAVQSDEVEKKPEKQQQSDAELLRLRNQCNKLKLKLEQQRQKGKLMQEEMRLSHLQVKRLQRRLQKYKTQKEILQKERQQILKHVQLFQKQTFDSQTKIILSYRLSIMESQVKRLRQALSKTTSDKQILLLKHVEQLAEQKFTLNKHINASIIAQSSLAKQLADMGQQMEQIRSSSRQRAVSSFEYLQLRQRYKLLLLQHRQLKQEMRMLQQNLNKNSLSIMDFSVLAISNDSLLPQ